MVRYLHRLAVALLLIGAGAVGAWPASAESGRTQVCFAAADPSGKAEDAAGRVRAWECAPRAATLAAGRVVVRLPIHAADGRPAAFLHSGIGRFDRLVLVAAGRDATLRSITYRPQDVTPLVGEPQFSAALPKVARPVAYYAVFDRATNRQSLRHTDVASSAPATGGGHLGEGPGSHFEQLLVAMLVGMLLVPALFDLAVYKALRKAFFLWHAALTLCMALLVGVWSGLVLEAGTLSMPRWHDLLMIAIGLLAATASMFMRTFAAASASASYLPRMLRIGGWYSLALTALYPTGWLTGPVLGSNLFSFALAPVFAVLLANLVREFAVGDRTNRMQVLGWVPQLLFFAAQLMADTLTVTLPRDGLPLLYIGVLVETVLSAFGVSLRFLAIRRERDIAMIRANVMGNLAERDHLTGLLNRRAIDNRFADLRARGYDTVALIDLDHFKTINDVSGHAVGDQVLEITARVLASDPDNIAVRLGGEEFLILLRGSEPAARAEKLRRMLSVRVAREVDGLEQIVTASMGLLSLPPDNLDTLGFSSAYSRADLLLYEAKREGRNRTKSADWRFFDHAEAENAFTNGRDIRDRSVAAA